MAKTKKCIVFTGGHGVTTALAVIQEFIRTYGDSYDIYWIGAKRAMEGREVLGIEHITFPKLGIILHSVDAGRLQRKFTRHTIPSLIRIPVGFVQSIFLLLRLRPEVVVSFGGYVGLPVVVASFFLRIPSILHEQTVAAGLANRLSSHFVSIVALARQESRKYFPVRKTKVVGNPIRKEILALSPKSTCHHPPVVFVTGGSRGSQQINDCIAKSIDALLRSYIVIHQTGDVDYQRFVDISNSLESKLQKRYSVYSTLSPEEMAKHYSKSDIVISRAGANTVSELLYLRKPSIFIPIPWAQLDEQRKNARLAASTGLGFILEQDELNQEILLNTLNAIVSSYNKIVKTVDTSISKMDAQASQLIVSLISCYL